jgi:tRNA-dihydrouridine synthase
VTAGGRLSALMVGRGALIKPWIFNEYHRKQSWEPTVFERIGIYWKLGTYFKVLVVNWLQLYVLVGS